MRRQEMKKLEIKLLLVFLLSIAILVIALFFVKQNQYYSLVLDQLKADAASVHKYAEIVLDERSFLELNTIEDADTELYETVHSKLDEIRRIANIRFLYTAKMNNNGELIYVVDGLNKDDLRFCRIGDPIEEEIVGILLQCLNDEIVLGDEILNTEWGIVYVAYFPFHDSAGNVIGAIGMEFDCEHLYHAMNQTLTLTIVITLILAILTVAVTFLILRKVVKRTENDFQTLDQSIDEIHERVRLMLDTSPLCAQIWDKNLATIDCNEAAVRMYGFKDKQEYTEMFLRHCSPEYQPDGRRSDEKATELVKKAFDEGICIFDWTHKMPYDNILIPTEITLVRASYKGEDIVVGYTRDKRNEDKMVKEIEQRDKLLRAVNQAATLLLTTDEKEDLNSLLMASMKLIGNSIYADRIQIWRYEETGDDMILTNRYLWLSEMGARKAPIPADRGYSFKEKSDLISQFKDGIYTNSPVTELTHVERKFIFTHDLRSLVIIPLFLDNQLWGLFTMEDCVYERKLSEDELEILRSLSLMMATVITRHTLVEKRTKELALQTSLLTTFFDTLPDHVYVKDLDSKYIQCNKGVCEYFMRNRKDIIGKGDTDGLGLSLEEANKFMEMDRRVIDGGKEIRFEQLVPGADGSIIQVETIKTPLFIDGSIIGILGISRDITYHKEVEKKLADDLEYIKALKAEADRANQSKSLFLADMSHEIRTPMNAILGATEIMMQSSSLTPDLKELLGRISTSGELLMGIINDILDLSKIEAGKMDLTDAEYHVASTINDIVQLNVLRNEDAPVEFELQVNDGIPSTLIGDELRIKQIVNNLLSNAFKYTPSGNISMAVDFEPEPSGGSIILIFSVLDTGFGMTGDQLEKLFDNFSRFDNEDNITIEGTGLGLPITKHFIELMDGEIHVESEPGKGSHFTVRLPQKTTGSEALGKDITDSLKNFTYSYDNNRERRGIIRDRMPYGRVLVVDDVETNRFVAVGLLKIYKLQVDTANSGYEAIEMIKNGNSYDVIFMDHMMPGIDGLETTKYLRKMGYTKPIVALSANVIYGQSEALINKGFDDFIAKPVDIRQLNSILNKLIRDKQSREVLEAAQLLENEEDMHQKNTAGVQQTDALALAGEKIRNTVIPGIDMIKGLDRYDGDVETYLKILRSYAASVSSILHSIDYADESKFADFIIGVHSIKGASYDIFADGIGKKAESLESAARSGEHDYLIKNYAPFHEESLKLVTEIEAVITAIDSENPKIEKDIPDTELLVRLRNACEVYNMDEVDAAMSEIDSYKYLKDGGLVEWLRKSVDMMSFSQIVDRLADYIE